MELHYNVYGCFREPGDEIELGKAAADAGFEGVWLGDHFMPWIDSREFAHHAFPLLGALMNEIPDVPVGTSVSCPMLRYRPPTFAQAVATLDNMFPGRFELGVGVGEALNEAPFLEEWPDWGTRARMLIESLELMRELWDSEEYVTFDGDYFQYEDIKLYTRPKSEIPVHWAGWGPKSCELAGRYAGNVLTVAGPDLIEGQILPNFEKGQEMVGEDPAEAHVSTEFGAAVGDPDELVAEIRERGEYVPHDTELDTRDPRVIQGVADEELAAMSDEEVQDVNGITDDPEELVADIEELERAGVTRVLVGTNCGDPMRTIEAFEEHVIPQFE